MKVLMLSYYFPPLGMGGTQRAAKFAKYLPQFGWEPTVVTVEPIVYFANDPSLLKDVKDVRVIRTESWDPQRLLARRKSTFSTPTVNPGGSGGLMKIINEKVLPFFLMPDSKRLWASPLLEKVDELMRQESFDALFSTSPPHSTHVIAGKIARKYNLPWIADFRDAWAGSHVVHEPTQLQFKKNLALQKKVLTDASAVITVSPGVQRQFSQYRDAVHFIPNGFDPDDYPQKAAARNEKFTLCYSGSFNKFADPTAFFHALALLKKKTPNLAEKLQVNFVGFDTLGDFNERIQRADVADVVNVVGYKPHDEALAYVAQADALLLIANGKPSDTFVPGKTFEYIGARKPILAISNIASTDEILKDHPAVFLTGFDENNIALLLAEMMDTRFHPHSFDDVYIKQFNRKTQTLRLSEILNAVRKS